MAPFADELLSSVSVLPHYSNRTSEASLQTSLSYIRSDAGSIGSQPGPHSILLSNSDRHQPLRSLRRILKSVHSLLLAFSDWTVEWTPFILVVTYYIVSTAIFVMCSAQAVEIFYFFFSKPAIVRGRCAYIHMLTQLPVVTNFYVAASAAIESFLGLSPVREARRRAIKLEENGGRFPSPDEDTPIIDLVIVAFLPNEKDIVKDQIMYALEELVYPRDKLRVNLVYNTPYPIEPLETELRQMEHWYPQLRVEKVLGSKSKADNLNYFFTLNTGAYNDGETLFQTPVGMLLTLLCRRRYHRHLRLRPLPTSSQSALGC